jgi:hypothetical protein
METSASFEARSAPSSYPTTLTNWVPHDVRDQIVDFVRRWSEKTEIGVGRFIQWLGVAASKFYDWRFSPLHAGLRPRPVRKACPAALLGILIRGSVLRRTYVPPPCRKNC